ncbi:extracellular solute-binding protein [Nakamurella deserti]|uniref:extracellular solute-binding protein n=1 Tax=Nakamurella deserti TaxID=2164074 RepID=UPI00197B9F3B|nr:extracellular solute-binding protein [Nakamurella deserti]
MTRSARRPLVALALLSSLTVAACGGATPGGNAGTGAQGPAAASDTSAWVLTGGGWPVIEKTFDTWNDAHPEQKIAVEAFANDAYKEKIRTSVGSGQAPTLIMNWTGGALADYVENGQVADITAETAALVKRVTPSVAENGVVDGKTYAVPLNDVQPVVLYTNEDVFASVGVEVPKTFDDLLAVVPKFREAGIAPISIAGQSVWPELMWLQYLTDRIGGPEVFQAILDGKPDAWSDPAVVDALTKIQQLVQAGAFVDGFASVTADAGSDFALVHTGKAAMILQGSWGYATFKTDAPEFAGTSLGFAEFPAVQGGAGDPANIVGNPANFWSVSASAGDASKKAALDYLNDSVYSDDQVAAMLAAGSVPPITGLEEQIAATEDADYLGFAYDLVDKAPHFQLSWDQALPSQQATELLTNLSKVFLEELTPEQFATAMNGTLG